MQISYENEVKKNEKLANDLRLMNVKKKILFLGIKNKDKY